MPLKHWVETALLLVLALITLLTGLLLSILPPLPSGGGLGFGILLVSTLLYPLMLSPTLRRNRADKEFRWLHAVPFAMVLLWGAIEWGKDLLPALDTVSEWYRFGGGLIPVTIVMFLFVMFSLHVIRRRAVRITALVGVVALLSIFAVADAKFALRAQVAEKVFAPSFWKALSQNTLFMNSSSRDLSVSSDPKEEAWRKMLRAMRNEASSSSSRRSSSSRSRTVVIAKVDPPRLPSS